MGWERKRGKIEEFNRLLRGATRHDVHDAGRRAGRAAAACATASRSTPTRACRATRRSRSSASSRIRSTGRASTRRTGRVTEGYGILQPRVSVTMASAAGSLFARIYAGHTGVDPYTTAVSDVYQDLFDEGIFTGKGLYDVDAFVAALATACRRTRCCRTTSSRACTRARRSSPTSRSSTTTRRACWRTRSGSTAGCAATGRSCGGCCRSCRPDAGWQRNRLPLIARWKILDNLRRSLMAPATVALLLAGWTVLPGSPIVWTAIGLARAGVSDRRRSSCAMLGHAGSAPARWRAALDDVSMAAARARAAGDVPRQPGVRHAARDHRDARPRRVHARSGCSSGRRPRRPRSRAGRHGSARSSRRMIASPLAGGRRAARHRRRRSARAARGAAAAAALGGGAGDRVRAQPAGAARREVARRRGPRVPPRASRCKTWRYFETFVGPDDHALPPDNVQLVPDAARRAPHVADQHRDGAARDARPRTTSASSTSTSWPTRLDATLDDRRGPGALRRPPAQLVRHRTLAPLQPALHLDRRQRQPRRRARRRCRRRCRGSRRGDRRRRRPPRGCAISAARAVALFDGMNFRLLYDPRRQLFTIGYRLADAEGPGRRDASHYDLLASEARLASFLAIAKGDVPESHWFHLGRAVDHRPRRAGAAVVERHDVRVPDAAAPDAQLSRHAARRVVPDGRAASDRLRARRAACRGASRSRPTTPSIGTTPISTRRSACPGSA